MTDPVAGCWEDVAGPMKKDKRRVARLGWNGKGLYVQVHGSVRANDVELAGGVTPYVEPFFVIVNTVTGTVNTWVPSVSDLNAKDWVFVL